MQKLFEGAAKDGVQWLVTCVGEALKTILEIAVEFEIDRHVR